MLGRNNPYNIRDFPKNQWFGRIGQTNGFVDFKSEVYATRAMLRILNTYVARYRLNFVSDILYRYAPLSENDTKRYIRILLDSLGHYGFGDVFSMTFDYLSVFLATIQHVEIGRPFGMALKSVEQNLFDLNITK